MGISFVVGYLVLGNLLKIPPLEIVLGMGPELFRFSVGATSLRIRPIPFGSSASYEDEEEKAEHLPSFAKRLILTTGSFVPLLVLSWVLSGTMPFASLGHSLSQLISIFVPWGESGPQLISLFDSLLDQDLKAATAVLAGRAGLWNLLCTLTSPFLWREVGSEAKGPIATIGMVSILVWSLATTCVAVNVVRYLL